MKRLNLLAIKALRAAERVFLFAHGWRSVGDDYFVPPSDFPLKKKHDKYYRVHAVNAQRQVYAQETKGMTGE
jgi:hypothetical protein